MCHICKMVDTKYDERNYDCVMIDNERISNKEAHKAIGMLVKKYGSKEKLIEAIKSHN